MCTTQAYQLFDSCLQKNAKQDFYLWHVRTHLPYFLSNSTAGVMGNCTGAEEEVDTVEENLCKQIEQEKKV